MGLKGITLLQLDRSYLLFFFTLRNPFLFSLPWAQSLFNPRGLGFTFTGIVSGRQKWGEKRQKRWGCGGEGDEERAVPGEVQGLLNAGGIFHSFLFLPLVAEPDAHHVFLKIQLLCDGGDLLRGGPRLDGEVGFQRALFWGGDGRALALLLRSIEELRLGELLAVGLLGLLQPRLQDGLEGDHVVV